MARVDPADVQEIVTTDASTGALLRYINAASALTDTLLGRGLSDATLVLIELYLAADLVYGGAGSGVVQSERIGDAAITYATGKDGHSSYWQTANRLSGGLLADLNLKQGRFLVD